MITSRFLTLALSAALPLVVATVDGKPALAAANDVQCSGCVGTTDLKDKAITSKKIKDGQVKRKDLYKNAQPSGLNYIETNSNLNIPDALGSVRSVVLKAPTKGYAHVTAHWYFRSEKSAKAWCYLSMLDGGFDGPLVYMYSGTIEDFRESASITRSFKIPKGKTTFYLNCRDDGDAVQASNIGMNALFVPNRYKPSTH